MFDLVKTTTQDGLILKGLYSVGSIKNPVVIHIHGFGQDFFSNDFIESIAIELKKNLVGFLSIQTRGMGNEYRIFKTSKKTKVCGTKYELLEEAALDIDAWIVFLNNLGIKEVILQGHSLGSVKVVRYLSEGKFPSMISKLILLSPYDKNYLAFQSSNGKLAKNLTQAKEKIKQGLGAEFIPPSWDSNVHTYLSYYSFYQSSPLSDIFSFYKRNYNFPILNKISIPVLMLVGEEDPYFNPSNLGNPQQALSILQKHIRQFSGGLIPNTKHRFLGKEKDLSTQILKFII